MEVKENHMIIQKLKEAGAADAIIARYQSYLASGDKKGQERMLCRCRRMKNEKLQEDREKLSRLDYIIARVENTDGLFAGYDSSERA